MNGETFKKIFVEMVSDDAIPVGIQRKPDHELGNYLPFVYTCPENDAVVSLGDSLYVLASSAWWSVSKNKYCLSMQTTECQVVGGGTVTGSRSSKNGDKGTKEALKSQLQSSLPQATEASSDSPPKWAFLLESKVDQIGAALSNLDMKLSRILEVINDRGQAG
jgi:hypothetical protein